MLGTTLFIIGSFYLQKLNRDVCELSTALAKAELKMKLKEEEVGEEIKKWEKTGEMPTPEILGRLVLSHDEVSSVRFEGFLF